MSTTTVIGVISDTHGLLRPQAVLALADAHLILHAGDIGNAALLDELGGIAPVIAVRGNTDRDPSLAGTPENTVVELDGVSIYMLHDLAQLDLKPEDAGFHVVITGHSHKPLAEVRNGVLYFNPGSAGPRRFKLPVSVGRLIVRNGEVTPELIELDL